MSCWTKGAASTPTESPTKVTCPAAGGGGAPPGPTVAPSEVVEVAPLPLPFGLDGVVDVVELTCVEVGGTTVPALTVFVEAFAAPLAVHAARPVARRNVATRETSRRRVPAG